MYYISFIEVDNFCYFFYYVNRMLTKVAGFIPAAIAAISVAAAVSPYDAASIVLLLATLASARH